jgi:hypothetical protein
MSMTRRHYEGLAKILSTQVEEINEEVFTEDEMSIALDTVAIIGEGIADMIKKENPGFDKARFMKDASLWAANRKP